MAVKKERLDVLLVEKGICTSRERAKTSIMAGLVYVDGQKVDKVGEKVSVEADIVYKGEKMTYVSRGGFTDCMLQNGAKKVFSVDVGYGQFAWKLRCDERVVCMERTNIRYVTPEDIGEKLDFASIDVSFISLRTIMPAVKELLKDNGCVVALIKPQFEAGKDKVGKKGVVRDKAVHKEVVTNIVNFLIDNEFTVLGLSFSPIKGPEGNREYLVYFTKDKERETDFKFDVIDQIIEDSHSQL